jgi:hypothetical protein
MNRKIFGTAAVSALAVSLLGGCASIQDQIAKQVVSGIVNKATNGQVSMNENNGNLTVKDNKGNVANIGGGDQRPDSVPADMPSLPGATAFGWFGSAQGGVFTFNVASGDYASACAQMVTLVNAAGWTVNSNGLNMEVSGTKTTFYQKANDTLTLTCSAGSDGKSTEVTLSKTPSTDNSGGGSSQDASGSGSSADDASS